MFMDIINLFNNPSFLPHGHCFLWTPVLLNLYIVAESLIALSYFTIPIGLIYFARRRLDFPYKSILWLFGAFITLCGTTHILDLWNIWNTSYWLEAWVKLLTGLVSVFTACMLFPLIPRAINLPARTALEQANTELRSKIEELELVQAARNASEQRYRQLVERAREGIWLLDNAGKTVFVNERLADMLGRSVHEVQGKSFLDFIIANEFEPDWTKVKANLLTDESHQNAEGNTQTFNFLRPDGEILNSIFSTSPVHAANGEPGGILGFVTDITEREHIARELSQLTAKLEQIVMERTSALEHANTILTQEINQRGEAQNHLQAVLNAAADGIIVADKRGQILTTNPAVETIFRYSAKDVIGKPLSMLMPEPFHHEHDSYIRNYLQTGNAKIIGIGREVMGRRNNGDEFPLDLAVGVVKLRDDMQFVGIVRDISERKAAQQQILNLNEQLSKANAELQTQIRERELAWQDLDIAHAQLETTLAELREQSLHISLLNEMSELLQAAMTVSEAGEIMQRYCQQLMAADAGHLMLAEGEAHHLDCTYAWGNQQECDHHFAHQHCWALRQAKPYPTSTLQRSLRCAHLKLTEQREALCLPLFGQGEAIGLLVLRGGPELANVIELSHHSGHRSWLSAFAEQISLALANIRLRERLRGESIRDPLTGLFNRRHLHNELHRIWSTLEKSEEVLTLMMIDIDHFKQVNDNYGHDIGDVVLSEVARRLQRNSRPSDVLARFGGEEFVLVMPGIPLTIAQRRAVAICTDVAAHPIRLPDGKSLDATVSIGVAAGTFREIGADISLLMIRADQAMYCAKEAGRNRVEVSQ